MIFRMVYKSGQIFLPFCHNPRVWQTRHAGGRTDSILVVSPLWHSMQRGNKTTGLLQWRTVEKLGSVLDGIVWSYSCVRVLWTIINAKS